MSKTHERFHRTIEVSHSDDVFLLTLLPCQEIEIVCWYNRGKNLACSHSNGSHALCFNGQEFAAVPAETFPYGLYPCTPMPTIIFVGGLLRLRWIFSRETERTKWTRREHISSHFCSGREDPRALVVFLNEELVVIVLLKVHWPLYHLHYLTR